MKMLKSIFALVLLLILGSSSKVYAEVRCMERCEEARQQNIHNYESCAERAKIMKDRLMAVKHKANCHKQYPLLDCKDLAACEAKFSPTDEKKSADAVEAMTMEPLSFPNAKKAAQFAANQTVEIQYLVKIHKKGILNLWFDQDMTVYDMHGNQVLDLQDSFKRSGEMVTSYNFKSSFMIPEDLPAGQYKIKIQVREKFSRWQGQQEQDFSVSEKKKVLKGA